MEKTSPPASGPAPKAPAPGRPSGVPLFYLLPLRVYLGYAFARVGHDMLGSFLETNELRALFARWATDNPYPVARTFLAGRGQLWSELFAYLVAYGAIVVGAALALGLFTRGAALTGAVLVGATIVLGGHTSAALTAQGQLALVALLTVALAGAGRTLGIDLVLHKRASVMPFTLLY